MIIYYAGGSLGLEADDRTRFLLSWYKIQDETRGYGQTLLRRLRDLFGLEISW